MQRTLTPATTLDNLRKEAKRWLKALRENNAKAREHFQHAYPNGPSQPVLRDVQHALARVYGQNDWKGLKQGRPRKRSPERRNAGRSCATRRTLPGICVSGPPCPQSASTSDGTACGDATAGGASGDCAR